MFDFITKAVESVFDAVGGAARGATAKPPAKQPPPEKGNGGGTPEDLTNALGHYTEHEAFRGGDHEHDWEVSKFQREYPDASEAEVAAYSVGQHYEDAGKPLPDGAPLGNLDSPDARIKAVAKLTQQQNADSASEEKCGASSIVGGVLLAGGTDGLVTLMDAMEKRTDDAGKKVMNDEFKKLREEIKKGKPITVGDMHMLQSALYDEMKVDIAGEDPGNGAEAGVKKETMDDFIHGDEKLSKLFAENHMEIEGINNHPLEDGDDKDGPVPGKHYELNRSNNHAVLEIKDAEGKVVGVYDPYKRDKGQVVTDKDELDDYGKAHEAK
jgi:hypothetical protein